jgi:hypothetical protein
MRCFGIFARLYFPHTFRIFYQKKHQSLAKISLKPANQRHKTPNFFSFVFFLIIGSRQTQQTTAIVFVQN